MSKKDVLAAIDEAIAGDLPPSEPEGDPITPPAEPDPAPEQEQEAGAGEAETTPAEEPHGEEPLGEEPPAVEPEPTAPPAKAEAKPSDEFGELPKDAKQETRERFTKMRDRFDEVSAELKQKTERMNEMIEVVTRTGATGEQFDAMLQYLGARNSGNLQLLEQAYAIAKAEFEDISKQLGKPIPGVLDPLEAYPDLKAEVDSGEISQQRAQELAAARTANKLNNEFSNRQSLATKEEAILREGYAAISALGKRMRSENRAKYDTHIATLTSITNVIEQSGRDPREWAGLIEAEWKRLPDVAPAPAKPKVPTPIRPTGMTGAPGGNKAHKEPGNAVEAIDMALNL